MVAVLWVRSVYREHETDAAVHLSLYETRPTYGYVT